MLRATASTTLGSVKKEIIQVDGGYTYTEPAKLLWNGQEVDPARTLDCGIVGFAGMLTSST